MPGPLPRLRLGLDFIPSSDPEHPGLLIRDPLKFSDAMLLIPPQLVECLACFDGEQTSLDLRANLVRITGEIQIGELEKHLFDTLSQAGFPRRRGLRSAARGARQRIHRGAQARSLARRFGLSGRCRRSAQDDFRIYARRYAVRVGGFAHRYRGAARQPLRRMGILSRCLFRPAAFAPGPHLRGARHLALRRAGPLRPDPQTFRDAVRRNHHRWPPGG